MNLTFAFIIALLFCIPASAAQYENFPDVESSGFGYPFPATKPPAAKQQAPQSTPVEKASTPQLSKPAESDSSPITAAEEPIQPPAIRGRIAIIIDDIGYSLKYGLRSARFPGALTLAVLPHSPNGLALAELGNEQGKSIMLHTPMSNLQQLPLDPGGLTIDMTQQQLLSTLREGLASIPHVVGINNHMGSHLTQLDEPMGWLMEELKRQQLFFIDSRTSADSRAWEIAQQHQVASLKRDVFLDHERNEIQITRQFEYLIDVAIRQGSALAIGHPYPETLKVLEQQVPQLRQQGIELVSIEKLLPTKKASASENIQTDLHASQHKPSQFKALH